MKRLPSFHDITFTNHELVLSSPFFKKIGSATDEIESGQCVSTGRGRTRETPGRACFRQGPNYTEAYKCAVASNVCCQPGGSLQTEWGECTRVDRDEEEEEQMNDEISVDEATLVKDSSDSISNESVSVRFCGPILSFSYTSLSRYAH